MNLQELTTIQSELGIKLPSSYINYMNCNEQILDSIFKDAQKIVETTLNARKTCWTGSPLLNTFFIFGRDSDQRFLFFDLDIPGMPGTLVFRQVLDSIDSNKKSEVISKDFTKWIKMQSNSQI